MSRRVIFVCLILYIAVAALLEGIEVLTVSRQVKKSLDERIVALADQNLPALSRAVWNLDNDITGLILAGMANDGSIGKVVLDDELGRPSISLYSSELATGKGRGRAEIDDLMLGQPRSFKLSFASQNSPPAFLGTLTLYPSLVSEHERIRQTLLLGLGRTAIIVVLLLLVLFLAIEHFLGKPLRVMARQITAIDPADPGSVHLMPTPGAGGEFLLVSSALNAMAARIGETMDALRESERRVWSTFEDSPISLWDEDFSLLKRRIDELKAEGIVDWKSFFASAERVVEFNALVRVRDVNRTTLKLLGIEDKAVLTSGLPTLYDQVQIELMRQEFIALASGATSYEGETDFATPEGRLVEMEIRVSVVPGSEDSWDHVLASVIDITNQKAAERFLIQSLNEKELLLREVHHRVKNNLQIVSSIVSLQRGDEDPASPVSRSLIDIESRIWSMALVHELLYENESFAFLDFAAYTRQLCDHLIYSYLTDPRRVRFVCEVDSNVRLPLEKAIPLGLIINELVVNSLKYAFGEGRRGELAVKIAREGDTLRLEVEDDGPGLHGKGGHNGEGSGGVGFSLVEGLAAQLGGTRSIQGEGRMHVSVVFPG